MALAGKRRRAGSMVGAAAALGLVLAACADTENIDGGGDGGGAGGGAGGVITAGTTDTVTNLDPAGAYDNGTSQVHAQVFGYLMNTPYGSSEVEPDLAESAEFTSPTEYTVTLREGLTFANGNELTASDVKFSFDRQVGIAHANGPSSLLYNLEEVEVVDDLTVTFHLGSENDQVFPQILSSPAGPIVDEEVFSADGLTPAQEIVDNEGFSGPYTITDYSENELIQFAPADGYGGILGPVENAGVSLTYYTDETSMKLAVQQGDIDVAHRSLSPTDLEDLSGNENLTVHEGPGGEIRYIVFNFNTQPYGAETEQADPERALAVRQAVAHLIDREALSEEIYAGTYTPLYSYVPEGLTGAVEPLREMYGDGEGGPDPDAARQALEDAGVETPVQLDLQYNSDHYGNSSDEEYAMIESQLEADGLFEVNLAQTLWDTYSQERTQDLYPAYQLGWFPDYSDADNYLTPFFTDETFLLNHYDDAEANELIRQQAVATDEAERTALIEQAQEAVAEDLSTIPFLQGAQIAVAQNDVEGVTLDSSFKFRFAPLHR
ncbi:ABC transporter substrate-binding protein [Georgenia alba]|uniref:ABC transporter substrate-binding protein n=1 Tax=Georgenia alba TaxID=2233858 RepID=A0ABW2Q9Y9_9MICO